MFNRLSLILLFFALLTSCGTPTSIATPIALTEPSQTLVIVRHPRPIDYTEFLSDIYAIPGFDPDSNEPFQVDLRSRDLTNIDISNSLANLIYADFDSKTQWPSADMMPEGFDYQRIMELGKDPGLGMRVLHTQGITGKGVGIAIIDQPLLVDHMEYRDRLQMYEEINVLPDTEATMHGAAVTSIAVGKTVGVAPGANLYYVGAWTGDWEPGTNNFTWNFEYYAQAVRRILEINRGLPQDRKIRVIAMQVGWNSNQAGWDEITAAVMEAKAEGIFVVSSSLSDIYGFHFQGMGRDPLADPNQFEAYLPGIWWASDFYANLHMKDTLLIPMDSRTTASPTGINDYAFYRQGGWSWSIPYIAGTYALAVQVKPDITPEEFWKIAIWTGKVTQLTHEGKGYPFGVILDPQALIASLQK